MMRASRHPNTTLRRPRHGEAAIAQRRSAITNQGGFTFVGSINDKSRFTLADRVNNKGGFTLAEMLMTVALVGLLTLAVAAGIGVAAKAFADIRHVSEAQAVYNNAVTAVSDELRFAYDVESTANTSTNIAGSPTAYAFNSTNRGYRLFLGNSGTDETAHIQLNAVSGLPTSTRGYASFPSGVSTTTPLPLINTATASSSSASTTTLTVRLTSLTWNRATHTWAFTLALHDAGGNVPDTIDTTTVHTVRAVNNW